MSLPLRHAVLTLATTVAGAFALPVLASTPAETYEHRCSQCHSSSMASAPRPGDRAEWTRRVRAGFANLQRGALAGVPNTGMGPKGGHRDLTDAEVLAVLDWLLAGAGVTADDIAAGKRYDALGITDREFIRLDRDRDGALSAAELSGDAAVTKVLAKFDADRDGRLSHDEYLKAEAALLAERTAAKVDDATLRRRVTAALAQVPKMPKQGIKVDVAKGAVTMAGVVSEPAAIRDAWNAVRRIAGVQSIVNRLVPADQLTFD
jgi:cytochrome c5